MDPKHCPGVKTAKKSLIFFIIIPRQHLELQLVIQIEYHEASTVYECDEKYQNDWLLKYLNDLFRIKLITF